MSHRCPRVEIVHVPILYRGVHPTAHIDPEGNRIITTTVESTEQERLDAVAAAAFKCGWNAAHHAPIPVVRLDSPPLPPNRLSS